MYSTKEKIQEIINYYQISPFVLDDVDIADIFYVVADIMEEEAGVMIKAEPYVTNTYARMMSAVEEIKYLAGEM